MSNTRRNVILTHVPHDDQWPYCQLMSREAGREFHVEYMSTGNGTSRLRCLLCYVFFPFMVFLRRHRYADIVAQQQFYGLLFAFYCRLFHVRKHFRLFVLTFIYLPKAGLVGRIYRSFMRYIVQSPYIDAFTVHTPTEPALYASQLGVDASRFHYIPLGMNELPVQPDVASMQQERYILAVGRSNRDYDFLVETLRDTSYPLHILCDNYHPEALPAHIHVHHDIFDQMPLWLHNCHCVVIPLRDPEVSSGQLVLLQAMQFGKPTVVTRSNALSDYITDGLNAITIDNEPSQLLSALGRLYGDAELYQRLSAASRQSFWQRHTAERQVEHTAHLIRSLLVSLLLLLHLPLSAQDVVQTLDVTAETALGSGSHTAYYLTANRHGTLSMRPNTGSMRAAYQWQRHCNDWVLTAGADMQVQAHADDHQRFYLQQLYAEARWRWLDMRLGSRETGALMRDQRLSSGSLIWSGNARPIPGLYLGTHGFIAVPGTHGGLEFYLDGSYGYYLDSDYLTHQYELYASGKTGYGRSYLTTHVWSHQKRFALRTDPSRTFCFTFSCEHAVQFGGSTVNYILADNDGSYSPLFVDFLGVLVPMSGGESSASGDQSFIYGNHIGEIGLNLDYRLSPGHQLSLYLENPFEDGSGFIKRNGWDGLWGVRYSRAEPYSLLSGVVIEYLQTSDQSGAIHWAPTDFTGQEIAHTAHAARGADDYYNNYFYCGYSHFGQACGSPMLKSPGYNADHYLRFTDTRVEGWHVGIEGTLYHRQQATLGYRLLASHRQAYGTYFDPSPVLRTSTDGLLELSCRQHLWSMTCAYAFDRGNLYGDAHNVALRFTRHFRL